MLMKFKEYLIKNEKSPATVEKYTRDAAMFIEWLRDGEMTKTAALMYKERLKEEYAPSSVNTVIAALNSFFEFMERADMKLKAVKVQKQMFVKSERELNKRDYERLLDTARRYNKHRLSAILQTLFATGLRISELRYMTVEALNERTVTISCKGKVREICISDKLRRLLKEYAKRRGITSGSIFITRNGNPIDRSNLSKELKKLAALASVAAKKVFPHNFRHLFARVYYKHQRDISALSSLLGHSSINTTRIYIMESYETLCRQLNRMQLVI